jgi:hypothetical protein
MRTLAAIAVLASLFSSPAWANWEYTRWGMTPEQATAASNGAVKLLPPDQRKKLPEADLEAVADGTWTDGPLKLHVGFSVDMKTGGLKCVFYNVLDETQNKLLKEAMVKRYGAPQSTSGLPAIGMETLHWSKPDSIDLNLVEKTAAFVLHCAE